MIIYKAPNYTQVPNAFMDEHFLQLSLCELRIMIVLMRKILGWHKQADRISISQLSKKTKMSESSVCSTLRSLIKKGFVHRKTFGKNGTERSYYSLMVDHSEEKHIEEVDKEYEQMSDEEKMLVTNISRNKQHDLRQKEKRNKLKESNNLYPPILEPGVDLHESNNFENSNNLHPPSATTGVENVNLHPLSASTMAPPDEKHGHKRNYTKKQQQHDLMNTDNQHEHRQADVAAAVSFKQKNQNKNQPIKIHESLDSIDIPMRDKIEISKAYDKQTVFNALAWALHENTKLKKGLAPALKWACEEKICIETNRVSKNNVFLSSLSHLDGKQWGPCRICVIDKKYIEFSHGNSNKVFNVNDLRFIEDVGLYIKKLTETFGDKYE